MAAISVSDVVDGPRVAGERDVYVTVGAASAADDTLSLADVGLNAVSHVFKVLDDDVSRSAEGTLKSTVALAKDDVLVLRGS